MSLRKIFRRMTEDTSRYAGKPVAFILATSLIVLWALTGPLFGFGDTWQLVINTSTTIITFLMVFLIQSSQNRDTAALQIKLDELIRTSRAHNALLNLEQLDEDDLERIRGHYFELAKKAYDSLDTIELGINDLHNDEDDAGDAIRRGGAGD
ncbi:MAG: low affinity iron permease family protein [Xanthomonadaceae bacterium]|jgi:low affinity Fe/Cu permease|nr:low affinity iron permease family protein [Xanthomonadaceae bacterium]